MERENVIKALKICRKHGRLGGLDCRGRYETFDSFKTVYKVNDYRSDCPYGKCETGCVVTLADDILQLLSDDPRIEHGN